MLSMCEGMRHDFTVRVRMNFKLVQAASLSYYETSSIQVGIFTDEMCTRVCEKMGIICHIREFPHIYLPT